MARSRLWVAQSQDVAMSPTLRSPELMPQRLDIASPVVHRFSSCSATQTLGAASGATFRLPVLATISGVSIRRSGGDREVHFAEAVWVEGVFRGHQPERLEAGVVFGFEGPDRGGLALGGLRDQESGQ